jgi:hypothetical protein
VKGSDARRALEQAPDGRSDWKPHDRSMLFGYLVSMVPVMPQWAAVMMLGSKVPALYGPSADDRDFR